MAHGDMTSFARTARRAVSAADARATSPPPSRRRRARRGSTSADDVDPVHLRRPRAVRGLFGAGLGAAGAFAVRRGHCRNRLLRLRARAAAAAAAVGASYYWAYESTLAKIAENNPGTSVADVRAEVTFARWVDARKEAGWTMRAATPRRRAAIRLTSAAPACSSCGGSRRSPSSASPRSSSTPRWRSRTARTAAAGARPSRSSSAA